jgi:phosphate:Na+ symporter
MRNIQYTENVVDNLQREIAKFLDKISEKKLCKKEAGCLLHFAAIVDDIERIADQSTNIAKLARYRFNYKVPFSKDALNEIEELKETVNQSINDTISLLEKFNMEKVKDILEREEKIDQMTRESKEKHFQRFFENICTAEAGPIFIDILVNLERISDHCVNIAEYLTDIHEKYS